MQMLIGLANSKRSNDENNSITEIKDTLLDEHLSLESFPDEILYAVMSHLDHASLVCLGGCSRRMRWLCDDPILWSNRLHNDSVQWTSVCKENHPDHYSGISHPKCLYCKCVPKVDKPKVTINIILSNIVKSLWCKWRKPRIMIFGDGLDRSGIVGRIISNTIEFRVEHMLSGEFAGLGSGLNVSMLNEGNSFNFDFITVFTSPKKYRKRNGWIHGNQKLFTSNNSSSEPTDRLKLLSSTIDLFIYVNDYESSRNYVKDNCDRLHSIFNTKWTKTKSKIAIINCGQGYSAIELSNDLHLIDFADRKWKVWNNEDCLKSMKECLMWHKEI